MHIRMCVTEPLGSKVTQLHTYVYASFFRLFSRVGCHSVLGRVPCAMQKVLLDYLSYTESVHEFTPQSWLHPSPRLLLKMLP